jgi:hypothetical protein
MARLLEAMARHRLQEQRGQQGGDLRTLPVQYDADGRRYREFRSAVEIMDHDTFSDFPIKGPATMEWVLKFMKENGPTPTAWHTKWKSEGKLQNSDPGVEMHQVGCQILQHFACFDQLNLPQLAGAELLVRQIQMAEERHKDRFTGKSDFMEERHLFSGAEQRVNLCICPALTVYVAQEMSKESAIMKERRKAREERQLFKPEKEKVEKK